MRDAYLATDYEPHRWTYALGESEPMSAEREALAYAEIKAHARTAARPEVPLPERFCEHCGGRIEPRRRGRSQHPYTLEQFMTRRYCSQRCYHAARNIAERRAA
jgi:hypothetical protein